MAGLYLTNTEHCTLTAEDREKAWHILAILLSIGRPVRPEELALKCEFLGASPELVRFLCTVPSSPLLLMENGLVTASAPPVLQIGRRICTLKRSWNGDVKTYFRKRKGSAVDSMLWSVSKKRLNLPSENGTIWWMFFGILLLLLSFFFFFFNFYLFIFNFKFSWLLMGLNR